MDVMDKIKKIFKKKNEENNLGCNHNPSSPHSTLNSINKKNMVYPQEYDFYCNICHKGFRFIKNDKGEYVMKE